MADHALGKFVRALDLSGAIGWHAEAAHDVDAVAVAPNGIGKPPSFPGFDRVDRATRWITMFWMRVFRASIAASSEFGSSTTMSS